ncbi:MAG: CDP-alcohol phosphatidyltransferase family protein [Actinobacteria bacterium]|nr:CDP-alcohol phosphatidyltransferase family protein [Actinomycetota bacterium]
MLDRRARELTAPLWEAGGRRLAALGLSPAVATGVGFVIGVAACVAAALAWWWWALALWILNRIFDGLDGPLARLHGETGRGGFLDIMADFAIYGGFVVGVAVALPEARLACAALLAAYYVNGSAFLALSSLLERRRTGSGDERSLRFVGGLAEGSETIIVHSALCVFPTHAALIAWVFAGAVLFTAGQRIVHGMRVLRTP